MKNLALLALALGVAASPAAAQSQAPTSKPFMMVELRMAPFKGADEAETRRHAEAFLKHTGLKVLEYQDNEVVYADDIVLPPEGGGLAGIRAGFEKMRLMRALRARPHVSEVAEISNEPGTITVMFEPHVYEPEAQSLRSMLPPGARLKYNLNRNMHGLWVNLDISGLRDPKAAAAALKARYPEEIASAEIMRYVAVMTVRMGR